MLSWQLSPEHTNPVMAALGCALCWMCQDVMHSMRHMRAPVFACASYPGVARRLCTGLLQICLQTVSSNSWLFEAVYFFPPRACRLGATPSPNCSTVIIHPIIALQPAHGHAFCFHVLGGALSGNRQHRTLGHLRTQMQTAVPSIVTARAVSENQITLNALNACASSGDHTSP